MRITAVIMAGGRGERFWPASRKRLPKQFLSLTKDGVTLIQSTVQRVKNLIDIQDVYVVTNEDYVDLVKSQLPELPIENIIAEPFAKNTAPCIGVAASLIQNRCGDSIMVVLPSDHLIRQVTTYEDTLRQAVTLAEADSNLVTIGITPSYPETGYGYIKFYRDANLTQSVYKVDRFVEKPNLENAQKYIDTGEYLWNSGMFIWKTSTILENFKAYLPDMFEGIRAITSTDKTKYFDEVLKKEYARFDSISIDYGIMEKASNIFIIPGTFTWDDVGNWLAIERLIGPDDEHNVINGNVVQVDSKHNIVMGQKKLIAMVGVQDLVIVDTEDALLVCNKDQTQDIKKLLELLKKQDGQYL